MNWKIPLFKIYTDENDVRAVTQVIRSGKSWAIGAHIEKFEHEIARYTRARYALVFNSGTSALHAMLAAFGIGKGDEVIIPSFTFIATANAVRFVGATPVFAEIEPDTFGLDPRDVEKRITKKTRAIMPVHYGGCACRITELRRIAHRHHVLLLEDAAESLGAVFRGTQVGTFGDGAIFSFCAPKVITTGEGGAVVTDNKAAYEQMKLFRSHGRAETANYFATADYMDYISLGYNFRMSNITAALGISQLKKINRAIMLRQKNAAYLTRKLSSLSHLTLPHPPFGHSHLYQMYTIILNGSRKQREALRRRLNAKGIMAKVYYEPVHLSSFYRKQHGGRRGDLPITEQIANRVLTLPMYPTLQKHEMDFMAREIIAFFTASG